MYRFYLPHIPKENFFLNQEESRHITKVLRFSVGDSVFISDGKGSIHLCEIISNGKNGCELKSLSVEKHPAKEYNVHIAMAPTKNNSRFEWFLEKATEIGIDQITPIFCMHSERKNIQLNRLNKVLIGALKQSCQAYLPKLNEPMSFSELILKMKNNDANKFIATFNRENEELCNLYKKRKSSVILIGPEGDFEKTEIDLALQNGFTGVNLGNSRLRTETAGLVACHTISMINLGDF